MCENLTIHLIIIGAGWHGKEIFSYVRDLQNRGHHIILHGFVDEYKPKGPWGETKVIGNFSDLITFAESYSNDRLFYITATGDNKIRKNFVNRIEELGLNNIAPWKLQHWYAYVGDDVYIGDGTCLAPGVVVTTHVNIGKHCILNVKTSVSHDCEIGDFVNLNPGVTICGNVKIGEGCYIGAGATIIDKITIGEWSIIGAGAVVIDDIPPYVTAVGVPAKIIKYHK
ncbi:MAG: acetyltransferase [Bacteroidetes bacterium]|nr:acetyltransferase [Rhodothermia bacterium]MCX7906595.1 acetyltransferase [Bacteroidota bacterium]MDW8285006.1 acetyltransferase [Bacteroidota bacterium]